MNVISRSIIVTSILYVSVLPCFILQILTLKSFRSMMAELCQWSRTYPWQMFLWRSVHRRVCRKQLFAVRVLITLRLRSVISSARLTLLLWYQP